MQKELLEQDEVRSDYLKEFLVSRNLLDLLWMQQFSHDEYYEGSNTLWELANSTRKTKKQSFCLAMAKLAYLETVKYEDLENDEVQEYIRKFETAEDLVQIHVLLSDHLKEALKNGNFLDTESLDLVHEEVMKVCFSKIPKSHTIMTKITKVNLQSILCGEKLTPFGIIDMLTLVNPTCESFFSDALKLAGNQQDAEVAKFYSNLVWRRCWLNSE
jgi:hypothetical protein